MKAIRRHPRQVKPAAGSVRELRVQMGLPDIQELRDELDEYVDILMGRKPPPEDFGSLTLMEVADAYYARACEIQMLILRGENEGVIFKNSNLYKFRTGELRAFLNLAKKAAELGSRRLTQEQLEFEMDREAEDIHRGRQPSAEW